MAKPDGGIRLLGIPTMLDRLIQQAIAQALGPIFDPGFSAHSFGFPITLRVIRLASCLRLGANNERWAQPFRPGRCAGDAVRSVAKHIERSETGQEK